MTDTDALIEDAKAVCDMLENEGDKVEAWAVEAVIREVIALRAEIANLKHDFDRRAATANELANENEALRAEIARMRRALFAGEAALQTIGEPAPHEPPDAVVSGIIARGGLWRMAAALTSVTGDKDKGI